MSTTIEEVRELSTALQNETQNGSISATRLGTLLNLFVELIEKIINSVKGIYTKPSTGIPKSDLASDVQTSLNKADTALQEHQDISGKADKTALNSLDQEMYILQEITGRNDITQFSKNKKYEVGDYALLNGELYRFTEPHKGDWDNSDAKLVTILSEISEVLNKESVAIVELENYIQQGSRIEPFYDKYFTFDGRPVTPVRFSWSNGDEKNIAFIVSNGDDERDGSKFGTPCNVLIYGIDGSEMFFVAQYDSSNLPDDIREALGYRLSISEDSAMDALPSMIDGRGVRTIKDNNKVVYPTTDAGAVIYDYISETTVHDEISDLKKRKSAVYVQYWDNETISMHKDSASAGDLFYKTDEGVLYEFYYDAENEEMNVQHKGITPCVYYSEGYIGVGRVNSQGSSIVYIHNNIADDFTDGLMSSTDKSRLDAMYQYGKSKGWWS